MKNKNLAETNINTIRFLSVDAVEKARSGHPGLPLGAAPMAYVLWTKFLRHNPKNPAWPNRDRFILSAGHGSMLLYSLLYLTGYQLSLAQIKRFRQWGSKTPGHPEYGHTPGVEATTGPLGQGFGIGIGMAIAENFLANRYNRRGFNIFDYRIWGIVSDGDLMEGVSAEAASLAGNLKLGKIIYLYDSNDISIEGSTELAFCEDVANRFKAFRWHVAEVKDGNNTSQIVKAIEKAKKEEHPSLIIIHTHIGYGSPKQDSEKAHGEPLGKEALIQAKKNLNWPLKPSFYIPTDSLKFFRKAVKKGLIWESRWQKLFGRYGKKYPTPAKEIKDLLRGNLPKGWDKNLPYYFASQGPVSTRTVSGDFLNAAAKNLKTLLGGSADLAPSNMTYLKGEGDITCQTPKIIARNLHFGVREHAMGTILNGMALSKIIIPFGGTFLVFSDYMRPAVRLAALMRLKVFYVLSHDSIALGEDGPTHQPISHLMGLRAIPNLKVLRPADANETIAVWKKALTSQNGPTALILTRQKLPIINRKEYAPAKMAERGAYILNKEIKNPDIILIATGSEVSLILEAAEKLKRKKIKARTVSMPCWTWFKAQPQVYRDKVLPPQISARIAVEAGATLGWYEFVGSKGKVIGLDQFGSSAPGKIVMEKFGFTAENIVRKALEMLKIN